MTQLIVWASEISHSRGATEFTKTRKIPWDSVEILSNTCLYNISQLLGLFTCRKLANLSWNFVTETCKQCPETIKHRLCCEKLGTSHAPKGFAIDSFLERIVVERANDDLCSENVKNAVLIFSEVCPENSREIGWFFCEFAPKNPTKFDFFPATYQKPCIVWRDPSDLQISWIEVGINLEVNWLCLCDLAHFLWWKLSKIRWNVHFNFTLLI